MGPDPVAVHVRQTQLGHRWAALGLVDDAAAIERRENRLRTGEACALARPTAPAFAVTDPYRRAVTLLHVRRPVSERLGHPAGP